MLPWKPQSCFHSTQMLAMAAMPVCGHRRSLAALLAANLMIRNWLPQGGLTLRFQVEAGFVLWGSPAPLARSDGLACCN